MPGGECAEIRRPILLSKPSAVRMDGGGSMPTAAGSNGGVFADLSPTHQYAPSHSRTFAEEAEWCRARATTAATKEDAQMLLRIAAAFDELHASGGFQRRWRP
ncbi:hypothetical protein G7077_11020 [Sphingomonas piscis]|uniref:Uncharacterized protein n=1 Tax=Sphingomonas piscis TaxID=2714943 RepID=A0A6G7YRJ4_9SPHN|nr:hypothetical protein [Sphingomonas piscis]QIK79354.1 hypothetical protein G7077_11020 [Sphingomonas piscis]